ncbi:MAG TPA: cell envelope integrity protein TolA [Bryobacteraceae bacterium]|nr:cell envelope integrity protein TolA [Bryobacteraceae bacterium]
MRWVLGDLLELKDVPSLWPIRILVTKSATPVSHLVWHDSNYILVVAPGEPIPLGEIAGLLLDSNTPPLPPPIESGLRQLFDTLQAKGSHVTWGGPPGHPDLAYARMQLFATKPEYSGRFHIFLANVADGSSINIAETNAFGKSADLIEKEVSNNLASRDWQPVPVSGRPLDPRRDFGEHSVDAAAAEVYLTGAHLPADRKAAQDAAKAAVTAGKETAALGYEALAELAKLQNQNPQPYLQQAIEAGSRSANVYFMESQNVMPVDVLPMLKKAAIFNPRWAEPILGEAQVAADTKDYEELLKQAVKLEPRSAETWQLLAQAQLVNGHVAQAQGSWLRAEDAATSDAARAKIHQRRLDFEGKRLDAEEAARRHERDAAKADDQQARNAEEDRIRQAEEKANAALDAQAGGEAPTDVVPWWNDKSGITLKGTLTRVDCLSGRDRLWITGTDGKSIALLLRNPSGFPRLACGPGHPPRNITLGYSPHPDRASGTAGEVRHLTVK